MDLHAIADAYGVPLEEVLRRGLHVKRNLDDPGTFLLLKSDRPAKVADVLALVVADVPTKSRPVRAPGTSDGKYLASVVDAILVDATLRDVKMDLGVATVDAILAPKGEDITPTKDGGIDPLPMEPIK